METKTMLNKTLLSVFFGLSFISVCFSQEKIKHYPSVTLGVSALNFNGDVGKKSDLSPLLNTRVGYFLTVEQRFGKVLGISLGGQYGKLAGADNIEGSHLNFQSKMITGELLFSAYFDKLFKNDPIVSPFLNVGVGYMMFDAYGDLKNGSTSYQYWSDGSIRDIAETSPLAPLSSIIKRDYTYETQLKDSSNNYSRATLTVPMGLGMCFHMGEKWTTSIGFNYVMCLSDFVDNTKSGGNDSYFQAHVGLQYEFKKRPKGNSDDIDFAAIDHLDVDGDKIPDDNDRCLGTPAGVAVDTHGCPLDKDEDGVADYQDKEPNSKKGAKVDGDGVTIDEAALAKHQMEWDSLASERNEGFNSNPSTSYLKKVEAESKAVKAGSNTSKIPTELQGADINKDGYISADEITKTIDAFFEGENDFNVDKINALIDYFFEQ